MERNILNINKGWPRVSLHIIFWITYYLVFVLIRYLNVLVSPKDIDFTYVFLRDIWYLPVDMSATYLTIYFLIPKFLYTKRYAIFIILFLISVVCFILLAQVVSYYIVYPLYHPEVVIEWGFFYFDYFYSLVGTYSIVILAATIKLVKNRFEFLQQKTQLENQNMASELALLRSQINPHFLFNTLNNIDSMISRDTNKASDALIKLSGIMRYMLYEANTDKVPLEKEIEYIRHFVSLNRLRLKDPEFVNLNIEGDYKNKVVAPMLFVPFIENAFKHGNKHSPSPGITIDIKIYDKEIYFEVINYISAAPVQIKDSVGGIGLNITKRRLELLYPDNYDLAISTEDTKYRVKLKLNV